jgi:hypothetical protein
MTLSPHGLDRLELGKLESRPVGHVEQNSIQGKLCNANAPK